MKFILLIAVLSFIVIFLARAIRASIQASKTGKPEGAPRGAHPSGDTGALTDATPSNRLTCFPTRNPLTGKPLQLDSRSDEVALKRANLPLANNIADFARLMGVEPGELYWLMSEGGNHYTPIELKRRGKRRLIFAPKPRMKACQRWILRNVLDKVQPHPAAEGFRKGHGVLTHARRHTGRELVGAMDIHRFFDTVRSKRVYGVYKKMGYSEEAALTLCLLTTRKGRLPQGAPTSPTLANLVCRRMDARLTGLAKKFGASYSRYADDMAFSGDKELKVGYKRFSAHAAKIIKDEGFRLNPEKSHRMKATSRQMVTGVVVNKSANIPRDRLRLLRAILHNAKTTGLEQQNRIKHLHFKEFLRGQISYISMIRPDRKQKLLAAFDELK